MQAWAEADLDKTLPLAHQSYAHSHEATRLSGEDFRDALGGSRVRDILAREAILSSQGAGEGRVYDTSSSKEVLMQIQASLDGLTAASRGMEAEDARSVASQALAEFLQGVRIAQKKSKAYHNHAVKMLKQPYMHMEGSRYCLSLGAHSHSGPSAQQTLKKMNSDYRSQNDAFQLMEERILKFAVDLEKEIVLERRTVQELRRVLQLEKLEYARLLEKFEEMKSFYQTELTAEKTAFKDFKDELYKERERERDEWEKERDRYRARNQEREREVDRMMTRHQAEMAGLERDVERYKQETLREAAETDRVNKELERYQEVSHGEREKLHKQLEFTKKEGEGQAELLQKAREKESQDAITKIRALELDKEQALDDISGNRKHFELQLRVKEQEKVALHKMLQDREAELADSRAKLNTLAADNILLREVMTDLRVNNKRLSAELKEALLIGSGKRPTWKRA